MPKFRRVRLHRSFVRFQYGWKLLSTGRRYVRIRIGKHIYKFHFHRALLGKISSVTIYRRGGRFWLSFVIRLSESLKAGEMQKGKTAAVDFGLSTFLTASDGTRYESPLFFEHNRKALDRANRDLARKQVGSNNQRRAKYKLARMHLRTANQRSNYHWQLAHELCDKYATIILEELSLEGMRKLCGRKIGDLGLREFMRKLEWVAYKRGVRIIKIDKWYPSSKTCSECGHVKDAPHLRDRVYECEQCGMVMDRDLNAALNIKRVGMTCC